MLGAGFIKLVSRAASEGWQVNPGAACGRFWLGTGDNFRAARNGGMQANVHSGTAGQAGRGKWALQALCLVPAAAAAPALALAVGLASGHQIRTFFFALQLVALRDTISNRGWGFCAIFGLFVGRVGKWWVGVGGLTALAG